MLFVVPFAVLEVNLLSCQPSGAVLSAVESIAADLKLYKVNRAELLC